MPVDNDTLDAFKALLIEANGPAAASFQRLEEAMGNIHTVLNDHGNRMGAVEASLRDQDRRFLEEQERQSKLYNDLRLLVTAPSPAGSSSGSDEAMGYGTTGGAPRAKRLYSAVAAEARGHSPRSSTAAPRFPSGGSASGARFEQHGNLVEPQRLWVGSFGRPLLLSQQVEHAKLYLDLLPLALKERVTLEGHNGNSSYRFSFRSVDDMLEFEKKISAVKVTDWTDTRTGSVRAIRCKRDKTVEARKQGRLMALIYGQVHALLVASDRIGELKLGTSGRAQDVFYIASRVEMWELFKVVSTDTAGEANIKIVPQADSCLFWGIDPAAQALIVANTLAGAKRL
jgi:hypothetical protein